MTGKKRNEYETPQTTHSGQQAPKGTHSTKKAFEVIFPDTRSFQQGLMTETVDSIDLSHYAKYKAGVQSLEKAIDDYDKSKAKKEDSIKQKTKLDAMKDAIGELNTLIKSQWSGFTVESTLVKTSKKVGDETVHFVTDHGVMQHCFLDDGHQLQETLPNSRSRSASILESFIDMQIVYAAITRLRYCDSYSKNHHEKVSTMSDELKAKFDEAKPEAFLAKDNKSKLPQPFRIIELPHLVKSVKKQYELLEDFIKKDGPFDELITAFTKKTGTFGASRFMYQLCHTFKEQAKIAIEVDKERTLRLNDSQEKERLKAENRELRKENAKLKNDPLKLADLEKQELQESLDQTQRMLEQYKAWKGDPGAANRASYYRQQLVRAQTQLDMSPMQHDERRAEALEAAQEALTNPFTPTTQGRIQHAGKEALLQGKDLNVKLLNAERKIVELEDKLEAKAQENDGFRDFIESIVEWLAHFFSPAEGKDAVVDKKGGEALLQEGKELLQKPRQEHPHLMGRALLFQTPVQTPTIGTPIQVRERRRSMPPGRGPLFPLMSPDSETGATYNFADGQEEGIELKDLDLQERQTTDPSSPYAAPVNLMGRGRQGNSPRKESNNPGNEQSLVGASDLASTISGLTEGHDSAGSTLPVNP